MAVIAKSRRILLSAPMVCAVLEGRKTQTRRVIQPQPDDPRQAASCRFGSPGDMLWVGERWGYQQQFANPRAPDGGPIIYAADHASSHLRGPWRQSRYMPKTASRINLKICSVRVERLNRITPSDALAEGYDPRTSIADPIQWFRELWDSLADENGYGWKDDPWVWAIGFVKV